MTRPMPLVSLVMPTFNQAEYLAGAIESVLAQTYPHIEFIVLDDGSTDDTPAVLRRYEGRLRTARHDNLGQAGTLNKGWSMSHGDILGYLSSDDVLKPTAVAESVQALRNEPDAIASYCDFELIDAYGRLVRPVTTQDFSARRLVEDLVCFPGPGAFFRRKAFEHCRGWNTSYRQVPDFDFWLRAQRLGHFVRIPISLAGYRIHEASASLGRIASARAEEIIDVVANYWRDNSTASSDARQIRASIAMSNLLAARSHFSAGRVSQGVTRVLAAWRLAPTRISDALAWRILIGGLFRRPYYGLRSWWLQVGRGEP